MERPVTIVWFRGADLRLADNPAVDTAMAANGPVVPVYVHDPEAPGEWAPGANAQAWLARSLGSLDTELGDAGSRLVVRAGVAEQVLRTLVGETGAKRIVFSRRWEPWAREQGARVEETISPFAEVVHVPANLLAEPGAILTGSGTPYRVFTPFWKRWREHVEDTPVLSPAPSRLPAPAAWPASEPIDVVRQRSAAQQTRGPDVLEAWTPGEGGALERLAGFVGAALGTYESDRDRPDLEGTSRLSPHLAHGEVAAARVVHAVRVAGAELGVPEQAQAFVRQIAWREFASHVIAAEPTLPDRPIREQFEGFPWRRDEDALEIWQRGDTGFPIVDAGMNQLLMTGWMHNRVRMLVASFLTKDLLVPWQEGERWFWDNLVDADLANNAFGWQWVAGCGHDASPYFRIFNPTTQGRRFDPQGDYVRRWVPQLAQLPGVAVHEPQSATSDTLTEAGVELGTLYPGPMLDHAEARERALAAYEAIKT